MASANDTVERLRELVTGPSALARILGLGFYQAWIHISFLSPALAGSNPDFSEPVRITWLISMAGCIAMLLLASKASYARLDWMHAWPVRLGAPFLASLGTVTMALAGAQNSLLFVAIGAALTGIGAAGIVLECGEHYGRADRASAIFCVGAAYVVSFVVYFPITLATFQLAVALATTLPIMAGIALYSGKREHVSHQVPDSRHANTLNTGGWGVTWRFAQAMFVFGAALGLMWSITVNATIESFDMASRLAFMGAGVVGAAIALWSLNRAAHIDFRYVFGPVLPLIIAGFLLLPLVGPERLPIANAAVMIGFICFEMLTWISLSAIAHRSGLPVARVFGPGKAISYGGVMVGGLGGLVFVASGAMTTQGLMLYSFSVVMVVVILIVFLLGSKENLSLTLGMEDASSQSGPIIPGSLRDRDLAIASKHGLTTRESEVFLLLASGRSLPYIEGELHMSHGTANGHLCNIYRKLGVHSRQEFLNLLEMDRSN